MIAKSTQITRRSAVLFFLALACVTGKTRASGEVGMLLVRTDKETYGLGEPIALEVTVYAGRSQEENVRRVPDDDSPTPPEDMVLEIVHQESGSLLVMTPSAAKRRPPGWKAAPSPPFEKASATYSLRELFRLPWREIGRYTIHADWQGMKAEPFSFSIQPLDNISIERVIDAELSIPQDGADVVHHCLWVVFDDATQSTCKILYQRVDAVSHEIQTIARTHGTIDPLVLLRAEPAGWHRRVFVSWIGDGQLWYADIRSDRQLAYGLKSVPLTDPGGRSLQGRIGPGNDVTMDGVRPVRPGSSQSHGPMRIMPTGDWALVGP